MIARYAKIGGKPLAVNLTALFLIIGLALSGCSEQGGKPDTRQILLCVVAFLPQCTSLIMGNSDVGEKCMHLRRVGFTNRQEARIAV